MARASEANPRVYLNLLRENLVLNEVLLVGYCLSWPRSASARIGVGLWAHRSSSMLWVNPATVNPTSGYVFTVAGLHALQ
jgi:hypothetical protein